MPEAARSREQLLQEIEALRSRIEELESDEPPRRQVAVAKNPNTAGVRGGVSNIPVAHHIEHSPLGVIEWDHEFKASSWSERAEDIFGWTADEMLGKHFDDMGLVHEEDLEIVETIAADLLTGRVNYNTCSHRNYRQDGSIIHCEWFNSVILGPEGQLLSILSLIHDVTDRFRVEAELRQLTVELEHRVAERTDDLSKAVASVQESEQQLSAILDNTSVLLGLCAPSGTVRRVNRAVCEFLGQPESALIGKPLWEGLASQSDDLRSRVRECMRQSLKGHVSRAEMIHQHPDGTTATIDFFVSPIRNSDGHVVMLVPEGRDITALKRIEQQLRESEQQLSAILNNTSFLIGLCETDGTLVLANRAVSTELGYRESELIGRPLWDTEIFPTEEVRSKIKEALEQASGGQYVRQQVFHQRFDGSTAIFDFSVSPIRDEAGKVVMLVPEGRNISQLKQIERELRLSEEKFRQLVEDLSDEYVVYTHAADGTYQYVSPSFLRLLDLRYEDVIGRQWQDVIGEFVEDDTEANRAFQVASYGQYPEPFELNVTLPGQEEQQCFEIHGRPVFDSEGIVVGTSGIARNITGFRKAEAELLEAKERAESADQVKSAFLATMSHELRTPLNSIMGFTGIMLEGIAGNLTDEQRKQLRIVENSAEHLLTLINDILDISKIEAGQLEVSADSFHVPDVIDRAVEMIEPLARRRGLPVDVFIDGRVCGIVSDRKRLEQVLINLLNNAVKFTPRGKVRLECRIEDSRLVFQVVDTGIGISEQQLARVFRPFEQSEVTADRAQEGTGLGLAIASRLVTLMGGEISVESEPGNGSTFTFWLPCSSDTTQ